MTAIHDRITLIFQAVPIGIFFLLLMFVSSSHSEEEKPLRFGDPEVQWEDEEEEDLLEPAAEATPSPAVEDQIEPHADQSRAGEPIEDPTSKPVISPGGTAEQRVRTIIDSVKPDQAYPEEFEELLAIGMDGIPTLIEIFSNPGSPWQSRWIAAMALGRLGGEDALTALKMGIRDSLFLVRLASVTAMGNTQDPDVLPNIRETINDKALVVRSASVEMLGRLKDRQAVPLLIEALWHKSNFHRGKSLWIREKIISALGEIGDQEAIPELIKVLSEREEPIQIRGCEALAKIVPEAEIKVLPGETDCIEKWVAWNQQAKSSESKSP